MKENPFKPFLQKLSFRFRHLAQGQKLSQLFKPGRIRFLSVFLAIVLCAYFFSDILVLLGESFLPTNPSSTAQRQQFDGSSSPRGRGSEDYRAIVERNLFSSEGLIPGENENETQTANLQGEAVKSSLPLKLIGTIVLEDGSRSVATIRDESKSKIYPVSVNDKIPETAKILKIKPYKVIFVNLKAQQKEFIELPKELHVSNPQVQVGRSQEKRKEEGGGSQNLGEGIKEVSDNRFSVPREEVDKALSNLNKILTEARAVPHFKDGKPAGYKLVEIVSGSLYDKLGLKNGDVIKGVNGERVKNPGKAFEMLKQLKSSSRLELNIQRGGEDQKFVYEIQ